MTTAASNALETFTTKLAAWAVAGDGALPAFTDTELDPLRALHKLLDDYGSDRFRDRVAGVVKSCWKVMLDDMSPAERREARLRFPFDASALLPEAYHAWSSPLRSRLEGLLGCGEGPTDLCEAVGTLLSESPSPRRSISTEADRRDFAKLAQLLEEFDEWVVVVVAWRRRVQRRQQDRDPADTTSPVGELRKSLHMFVGEAREAIKASSARDFLTSVSRRIGASADGTRLKRELVTLMFRHPLHPGRSPGWNAWIEGLAEHVSASGASIGSFGGDSLIDDLLESLVLRPDAPSATNAHGGPPPARTPTPTLYALLRLLLRDRPAAPAQATPDINTWSTSSPAVRTEPPPVAGHPILSSLPHPPSPHHSEQRARITVIGGGIAGLTAAHELVERGFDVQLVEQQTELTPDGARLALGGVARTQWAIAVDPGPSSRMQRAVSLPGPPACEFTFTGALAPTDPARTVRDVLAFAGAIMAWEELAEPPPLVVEIHGHACALCQEPDKLAEQRARYGWAALAAFTRGKPRSHAHVECASLISHGIRHPVVTLAHQHVPGACPNRRVEIRVTPGRNACFVPGEHGYRFFPSFYRHLRDTMRRTPLYDDLGRETALSAHDNLVPTYSQVFARPGRALEFSRTRPRTLEEFRRQLKLALVDLKFSRRDLHRFAARVVRYLATGRARREATYEELSWWEFLTLKELDPRWHDRPDAPRHAYSAEFERQLKAAPQALVAMDAEFCDARTQGNIVLQLLLDQFLGNETTDSTLNGPTTGAWFDHWRRHLRAMGVRFYEGDLAGLVADESGNDLFASWGPGTSGVPWPIATDKDSRPYDHAVDYFVLAVDVVAAERITKLLAPRRGQDGCAIDQPRVTAGGVIFDLRGYTTYVPSRRDIRLARARRDSSRRPILLRDEDRSERVTDSWRELYERYEDLPLWKKHPSWEIDRTGEMRDPERPVYGRNATDRLQTFSGVQYYFRDDFHIARGHAYFQDTRWGLSAISQMQFWRHKQAYRRDGVRGILSVDIGSFYTKSTYLRQPAHLVSEGELADEVWRQVHECVQRGHEQQWSHHRGMLPLPQPFAYHIDDWLKVAPTGSPPSHEGIPTTTPFLVNNVGDWIKRPGAEPWDPGFPRESPRNDQTPRVWQASHGGYQVHFDRLVFAGSYVKTFTRMTTMEAANESARHAVNAILDHINSPQGRKRVLERMSKERLDDAQRTAKRSAEAAHAEAASAGAGREATEVAAQAMEVFAREYTGRVDQEMMNNLDRLDAAIVSGDYCKIWDPERNELEEFEFLRRVDDMLFEAGKPHMFDILGIDELVDRASPESDPLEALLTAVGTTIQRDWDLGGIRDGGGLKLLRELGERLSRAFAGSRPQDS